MAKPIVEFKTFPKDVRELNDGLKELRRRLRVDGDDLIITPDIQLPDESVETNEIAPLAITAPKIALNNVGDAQLRQGSAASVIGRAAGSTGNVADIAFTVDGQFLKRASGGLVAATIDDADIPSGIARDAEVTAAIAAHESAIDPHPTYTTAAELATGIANHAAAADPHPTYTTAAELAAALSALNLASGTYTPTLTNVANVDTSTAYSCQYMRVGSVVTVSGRLDVNATTATISTQVGISLPIASNFTASSELGGTAVCFAVQQSAAIVADSTNDRAFLQYVANDTADRAFGFSFTYRII